MRTGIIGCGNVGRTHAMLLAQMKDISLCGFADIKLERAKEFAKAYGDGSAFQTLEEMVVQKKLEAVHICTPHNLHVPMAVWLLERGIHVFMEKPAAVSREQMEQLDEAVKNSQAILGICFQNRYNDASREVERILAEGSMGTLKGARAFVTWSRQQNYYLDSGWRGTMEQEGGGALINQAIHTLDLLTRWMGRPLEAEAQTANHHLKGIIEVEDTLEAYIRYEKGNACFYATTAYETDAPVLIELAFEQGTVRVEENSVVCRYCDGREISFRYDCGGHTGKAYWGSGHKSCMEDFYRCLKDRIPYQNDWDSAKDTMELMFAIYESAGKQCQVRIHER